MYLEREASVLYFNLSRFYFYEERLSWDHYLDRMLALKNICEPNDPIYEKSRRILLVEEWDSEEVWGSENDEQHCTSSTSNIDASVEQRILRRGISKDIKGKIHFLSKKKGLQDWVFHQYDVDFHPSIPHGHYKGKNNLN